MLTMIIVIFRLHFQEPDIPEEKAPEKEEKEDRPVSVAEARAETPTDPHPETLRPPSVPTADGEYD